MSTDQMLRASRDFAGHEGVRHVESDAKVSMVGILDRRQGRCRIRQESVGPQFRRLVFDREIDVGIVVRNLLERGDGIVPHAVIRTLKGAIDTVLSQPDAHHFAIRFG